MKMAIITRPTATTKRSRARCSHISRRPAVASPLSRIASRSPCITRTLKAWRVAPGKPRVTGWPLQQRIADAAGGPWQVAIAGPSPFSEYPTDGVLLDDLKAHYIGALLQSIENTTTMARERILTGLKQRVALQNPAPAGAQQN